MVTDTATDTATHTATVVLFDIDGTLLDAHPAGREAMDEGFAAVTGRPDGLASIRFAGMTDPAIARAGLRAIGQPDDDASIARIIAAYLERLPAKLERRPPRVLPGVTARLAELSSRAGVALGVGTGNVEAGARAKLVAAGLDHALAFGGFGSDHEQRAEVLRAGAKRGAESIGRPVAECRVVVVGDTPKDVAAARAIGAECLAVATSHYDRAALEATGPSRVVADLATDEARGWLLDRMPR